MLKKVLHIGLTVSNLEKSIAFYRDVLGLKYLGQMVMEGEETDKLFNLTNCKARIAYLNGSDEINCPPIELIQIEGIEIIKNKNDLNHISISEVCFEVSDIEAEYQRLSQLGVEFLSEPQYFDFSNYGFSKSKAVYFKDPDGITLELIESI